MAEYILMTALSPTMETGKIASWSKKEGDTIAAGDVLCEVETDKATIDYESTQDGVLLKILVEEDGSANVGVPIGIIGEAGEAVDELVTDASSSAGAADRPEEAQPKEAPRVPEEAVQTPETVVEESPSAGKVSPVSTASGWIKASPLARKLAAERHIDLSLVTGSGPDGRIVKADIDGFRGVPAGTTSVGIAGQLGDLFESEMKRSSNIKDSSNILPGHGGILDRIDAILFASPVAYVFIRFIF